MSGTQWGEQLKAKVARQALRSDMTAAWRGARRGVHAPDNLANARAFSVINAAARITLVVWTGCPANLSRQQ